MNEEIKGVNKKMKIRGHHLLCMQLFKGEGYNDKFTEGMKSVIQKTRASGTEVEIITKADVICKNCPNCIGENQCRLGTKDVDAKDKNVIEVLSLQGKTYSYNELRELLRKKMDEATFDRICGTCRWYKAGLCSYQAFLDSFI